IKSEYRAKKLERWSNSDPSDLGKPFEIRLEVSGAARGTSSLVDAAVGLPLWWIWQELPEALKPADEDEDAPKPDAAKRKTRTVDFELERPFVYEVRWHIVAAPGFSMRKLPADETQSLGPGKLTRHAAAAAGGTVDVVDRFELAKRRLTPSDVESL